MTEIAHKYHFVELGTWLIRTLGVTFDPKTIPIQSVEGMIRLAVLCSDESLYELTISKLSKKLLDGTLAPTEILTFADRYHIRELQGVAYYTQLMAFLKNSANKPTIPARCSLSQDQRARLLAGYHSLVRKWERLRDSPFIDSPPCSVHGSSCAYLMIWRHYARGPEITQYAWADVLGKLQVMQNVIELEYCIRQLPSCFHRLTQPNYSNPEGPCMTALLRASRHILNDARTSLPEYFVHQIGGLDEET